MPIIETERLTPKGLIGPDGLPVPLTASQNNQIYCGLDSLLTGEIFGALERTESSWEAPIYKFSRAMQAPYMVMMQRGWAVDHLGRYRASQQLRSRLQVAQQVLNELAVPLWGSRPLNPNSPAQLNEFFYKAMRLPEQIIRKKGIGKVSTDREALEKLESHMHAQPFISLILTMRDLRKQLDTLECDVDADGRYRPGFNIAGTETGRSSSSENAFGTGGNMQNVAPGLRYIFQADPGYRLCSIDLEQVEAREVGFIEGLLFGDWRFLDACEAGDLHTANARLVWPELPWTGDIKLDRQVAETPFYREFSHRDMAKRGGHLSNYSGTAWTMARSLKIPQAIAEEFQDRYCRGAGAAFPAHPRWWKWTAERLQTEGFLDTLFGRRRYFFGRPEDDSTLREAIAYQPQGSNGDRMNLGLYRVWDRIDYCQMLGQGFDSITFQYPETEDENRTIEWALDLIRIELRAPSGRVYCVPGEAKVGWNWGGASAGNPDGLVKWHPGFSEIRTRRVGLNRIAPK